MNTLFGVDVAVWHGLLVVAQEFNVPPEHLVLAAQAACGCSAYDGGTCLEQLAAAKEPGFAYMKPETICLSCKARAQLAAQKVPA